MFSTIGSSKTLCGWIPDLWFSGGCFKSLNTNSGPSDSGSGTLIKVGLGLVLGVMSTLYISRLANRVSILEREVKLLKGCKQSENNTKDYQKHDKVLDCGCVVKSDETNKHHVCGPKMDPEVVYAPIDLSKVTCENRHEHKYEHKHENNHDHKHKDHHKECSNEDSNGGCVAKIDALDRKMDKLQKHQSEIQHCLTEVRTDTDTIAKKLEKTKLKVDFIHGCFKETQANK
ncbi:hypothetical protein YASMINEVIRUS_1373 [Yasminevirus sp. GU-2018]|uniref:Uncharacterized protein n=1 Tax=Yasminevirus sp. GU-2018 TaxID=2420051 RepID=A0A5K0UB07_9VIRU|nr:hypothetical protein YASMINEVIRUS_1373 [Yasminevirus sp. GU-2018]